MSLFFLKLLHVWESRNVNSILAKVEQQQLTLDDLTSTFGKPDTDEIQTRKLYNLGGDDNFNCKPPFRYLSFSRSALIIFEYRLEDNLRFYFDSSGKFCFFERSGL
ncbi:MAG: hypothetical protein JNL11_05630 [Bdellovibrionaceae bacterium]|nr:hypothetical protein [Pseudobdellovibrionaceae bacterium]